MRRSGMILDINRILLKQAGCYGIVTVNPGGEVWGQEEDLTKQTDIIGIFRPISNWMKCVF